MTLRPILTLKMLLLSSCIFLANAKAPSAPCSPEEYELAENYIKSYLNIAVNEMERTGMPASVIIAQGMLESAFGQSELAQNSKNHFGIKCAQGWSGESYYKNTREFRDGRARTERHCFRSYETVKQSYKDHSDHLTSVSNYDALFKSNKLDYKFWAKGLAKAGYATDPAYAAKLINLIEQYDLAQYDVFTNKYKLPTEDRIRQYNADPTIEMDQEIMALHVRIDQLENSIAEAQKSQAQVLELQADIKQELENLQAFQRSMATGLQSQVQKLEKHMNDQVNLINNMQSELNRMEAAQKAMLKIDPLADHFNEDGTPRTQVVIFPTRHHNQEGVFYQSGRRATAIAEGQSFDEIGQNYNLSIKDLRRYNDLRAGEEDMLPTGSYVFLEPKANMVTGEQGPHVVQAGESMLLISQRYGIKLSKLYHRNNMKKGEEPATGEFIFLNQNSKEKPRLRNAFDNTVSETFDRFGGGGSK
jgi:LysM repeat protein